MSVLRARRDSPRVLGLGMVLALTAMASTNACGSSDDGDGPLGTTAGTSAGTAASGAGAGGAPLASGGTAGAMSAVAGADPGETAG